MKAVQFDRFGGPEVLQVVEVDEPHAGPDEIRVAVHACGINALDWKLREGMMGGDLPQRVGIEISGVVDEVGDGVTGVSPGESVFGPAAAGAADFAVISDFARMPASLDFASAAALPVAFETAVRGLDLLGVQKGETLLINGGAGGVGVTAIQLALARGARVLVTASESNHERLRALGAKPTTYGGGLEDRVRELATEGIDRVYDMGPGGALPALVAIAGDPQHVLPISDFEGAETAGVKTTGGPDTVRRWDLLNHAAKLVDRGELTVPVQQSFPLEDVADAQRISQAGHVTGKLILTVR